MSKKPELYKGEVIKEFNNNRSVYASYSDSNISSISSYDVNEVRKKINNIFSSYDFIYRTKVNIVIDNQIISKKIIGVHENNLVTIDNEYIPINMIKDIYK